MRHSSISGCLDWFCAAFRVCWRVFWQQVIYSVLKESHWVLLGVVGSVKGFIWVWAGQTSHKISLMFH